MLLIRADWMDDFLTTLLRELHGWVAYASIFGILVACGLGIPLPEDISLILGGFLAHHHAVGLLPMMAVGFVGILAGDSLIYWAGRRVGNRVGNHGLIARIVTPEKRLKVEKLFARHGQKIVMLARFLPGVRAVTYFTAGSAGMKYSHFILWDGLAATVSAPLFVYLGYIFGEELATLIHKVQRGEKTVIVLLLTLLLGYLTYRHLKNRALKREALEKQRSA